MTETERKRRDASCRCNQLFDFINYYYSQFGCGPSYAEMLSALGISSRGHLHYLVDKLIRENRIRRTRGGWRNLHPVGAHQPRILTALPYYGAIAASNQHPLELIETEVGGYQQEISTLVLPVGAAPGHLFILTVQGDSMIEEHITDGDHVIVEKRDSYRENDILAILLKDENAVTLKKLRPGRAGTTILVARSHKHTARTEAAENVQVLGRVVSVLRRLS